MTCIVGIVNNDGSITMGGDSAGMGGLSITLRKDPKVFINGDYIIGFTSSFRMGQLLQVHPLPSCPAEGDVYRFMIAGFVPAIREIFKEGGYISKTNEKESGGTFLVGCYGRLFSIQDDFQVCETLDGYDTVGSGCDVAIGALYASYQTQSPHARVWEALKAAERYNAGVHAPFTILTYGGTGNDGTGRTGETVTD